MRPWAKNVDGESLLWAAKRLLKRPEDRKILIVQSDGFPNCPVLPGESRLALSEHLSAVVPRVEATGIEVIGIGIMDDAVKKILPEICRVPPP